MGWVGVPCPEGLQANTVKRDRELLVSTTLPLLGGTACHRGQLDKLIGRHECAMAAAVTRRPDEHGWMPRDQRECAHVDLSVVHGAKPKNINVFTSDTPRKTGP